MFSTRYPVLLYLWQIKTRLSFINLCPRLYHVPRADLLCLTSTPTLIWLLLITAQPFLRRESQQKNNEIFEKIVPSSNMFEERFVRLIL